MVTLPFITKEAIRTPQVEILDPVVRDYDFFFKREKLGGDGRGEGRGNP